MDKHLKAVVAGLATALTVTGAASLPAQAVQPDPKQLVVNSAMYSALGDSYAAGAGSGARINAAGQTQQAYPVLLADKTNKVTFLAEIGASTADVLAEQVGKVPATATQVTLTVGGNDLDFVGATQTCLQSQEGCQALATALPSKLAAMSGRLAMVIAAIDQKAPDAQIYVTGYPLLFQAAQTAGNDGVCVAGSTTVGPTAPLLLIPESRTDAIDAATIALNNAILGVAATDDDVTYVDVTDDFLGHGLCGTYPSPTPSVNPASYIQPIHVTATGVDLSNAPLHPTAAGQQANAAAILGAGFENRTLAKG